MTNDDVPIACTLGGADYAERLRWIDALNRDGLRGYERREGAVELRYDAAVRDRVRELVRRESECCAFLAFALDESAGDVRLTITAPERARDMADLLFEPFLTPSTAVTSVKP